MLSRKSLLTAILSVPLAAFLGVGAETAKADTYIGGWQKDYPEVSYGVISVETAVDTIKSRRSWASSSTCSPRRSTRAS